MAKNEKEEIILQFTVEQGDAIAELERTKKSIVQIKAEQKELNEAYKKGKITLDEYVSDNVRLEGILKKQQATYNNVQKSVTGVKTQLDKLIDSNQKISKDLQKTSQSFQEVAGKINIAGANIGDLSARFTSFLNPATAAVGVVTALGAAYASSTRGAQDLQRAQDLLSASTTVISNKLFSGKGGQFSASSILTKLQGSALTAAPATIVKSIFGEDIKEIDRVADALKRLRELELIDLKEGQKLAKDNLKIAEQNRRYRDDETKSLSDRLAAANDVEGSINAFESSLLKVQQDRLTAAQKLAEVTNQDLQAVALVKDIEREIADIQEDAEGKRTEALNGVLSLERQIAGLRGANVSGLTQLSTGTKTGADFGKDTQSLTDQASIDNEIKINGASYLNEALKELDKQRINDATERAGEEFRITQATNDLQLNSYAQLASGIAGIYEQGSDLQKAFAFTSIAIDTAEAIASLTAASEGNPANAFTFGGAGISQYISGLARIFGNIAAAKQLISGQAAGGGDFMTNGPSLLLVGDNPGGRERVTVEPISGTGETKIWGPSMMQMAGGGSLTAGNAGANIAMQSLSDQVSNQRMMMKNVMQEIAANLPRQYVGVDEFTRVKNRVDVKQSITRAGKRI
jgi:uncharacterized protein YoxC